MKTDKKPDIVVILPCYNEELCIESVVMDFRNVLPDARIFVYDNNSTDETAEVARTAGAIVKKEPLQGKGNVIRRMFSDIEADVYVMADGDGTYDASAAPALIKKLVDEDLDMVVGSRYETEKKSYRPGHRFGNFFLTTLVKKIFGYGFEDILSGYRVMSRRYVKTFPVISSGFEIETEMSVHALQMQIPVAEVKTPYGARPEASPSKLNTYRDGFRILFTIIGLMASERPRLLFGIIGSIFTFLGIVLAIPLLATWLNTGLVPRFPTAILCTGLMIFAVLSFVYGWLIHVVRRGRIETKRLAYLHYRTVASEIDSK
ncbi:glycosyltransferase [Desulfosarcina sp. OttesenSCG-928-B08]|nr:glycosyltransferase [Desulfosarcina sp. OttesenSCG-928-B08]